MLIINNQAITASIHDIIQTLRLELLNVGVERFKDIKTSSSDLQVTCPIHRSKTTGMVGMESSPSCGISLIQKGEHPPGTVHCFTCGYRTNLQTMVSNCFGYEDEGKFGEKWLISRFLSIEIENRRDYLLDDELEETEIEYVSEEELKKYRFYHPYMYKRGLTNEIIARFDIGFDNSDMRNGGQITFPVCDEYGRCVFVAKRNVNNHYFHLPKGIDKPLYGLHLVPKDCKSLVICESVFNCLSSVIYGRPAIALLGTGSRYQIEQLKKLPIRHFILGLDPDEPGQKGREKLKANLSNKLFTDLIIPQNKDINDLSKEEFDSLLEVL